MFTGLLAVIFLLKLVKKAHFPTPSSILGGFYIMAFSLESKQKIRDLSKIWVEKHLRDEAIEVKC